MDRFLLRNGYRMRRLEHTAANGLSNQIQHGQQTLLRSPKHDSIFWATLTAALSLTTLASLTQQARAASRFDSASPTTISSTTYSIASGKLLANRGKLSAKRAKTQSVKVKALPPRQALPDATAGYQPISIPVQSLSALVPEPDPLPKAAALGGEVVRSVSRPEIVTSIANSETTDSTVLAQTSPPPDPATIENLQNQLQTVRESAEFGNVTEGSPALSIANPVGYGADNLTGFIGASYQARTRFSDESDGAVGIGVGLGDARQAVGVELAYTFASFGASRDFGTGGFDLKVHRQFSEDFAVATGWNGFITIGEEFNQDFQDSIYGVATKVFRVRENLASPFSRAAISIGLGSGQFRTEDDFRNDRSTVNVFGSLAVRVIQPISAIVEWTGQDLAVGLSIVPFRTSNFVITPAVRDIVGAGDGARFVLGTGFSFKF